MAKRIVSGVRNIISIMNIIKIKKNIVFSAIKMIFLTFSLDEENYGNFNVINGTYIIFNL